jgi:hypothetical protein
MPIHHKSSLAATYMCCRRCGALYTLAQPCPCRTQDDVPTPALRVWPLALLALLCLIILFCLIGWQGLV